MWGVLWSIAVGVGTIVVIVVTGVRCHLHGGLLSLVGGGGVGLNFVPVVVGHAGRDKWSAVGGWVLLPSLPIVLGVLIRPLPSFVC